MLMKTTLTTFIAAMTVTIVAASNNANAAATEGVTGLASTIVTRTAEIPAGKAMVPGGRVVDLACVHEIPNGAEMDTAGDVRMNHVLIEHHNPCSPEQMGQTPLQPIDGGPVKYIPSITRQWADDVYAWADNVDGAWFYNHLYATWQVPAAPAQSGGVFFIFPSLANQGQDIIQPVLQWGNNGLYGGNYWTISTWHATETGYSHSPGLGGIHSGDEILGIITMDTATAYVAEIEDLNTTTYSSGAWNIGTTLGSAQAGVLEIGSLSSCGQLPTDVVWFYNVQVSQGAPTYNTYTYVAPNWVTQWDVVSNPSPNCHCSAGFDTSDNGLLTFAEMAYSTTP
jgi:hypothetical protein